MKIHTSEHGGLAGLCLAEEEDLDGAPASVEVLAGLFDGVVDLL